MGSATDPHVGVSIKVRPTSGCFHREHSPHAFALIDRQLGTVRDADARFVEHESGPELLVDVGVATITLAATVINLVVAIINARSRGVGNGDGPSDPIELIVRRSDGSVEEETILRIGTHDPLDRNDLERRLNASVQRIAGQLRSGDEDY